MLKFINSVEYGGVVIKPGTEWNGTNQGWRHFISLFFSLNSLSALAVVLTVLCNTTYLAVLNKVSLTVVLVIRKYFQLKPTVMLCKKPCKFYIAFSTTFVYSFRYG